MKFESFRMDPISDRLLLPLLLLGLVVMLIISLGLGAVDIDLSKALGDAFYSRDSLESLILIEIRLPRALLALLIGATLGLAGAAMQGLLRNPLAEPGIVGVSNGAALGAVMMFYYGYANLNWFFLPLGGLLGALCAVSLILWLVGRQRSIITLILAGIAINAIGGALIALALNFAASPYAVQEIVFWLLGSVANRSFHEVTIALPFILIGGAMMLYCGRFLNALTLGEDTARTMGFNVPRMRLILILGVASSVGAAVSVAGNIGFIGLVVPHLVRPLVGFEPRRLLLASTLVGAILLLLADAVVQSLSVGSELKLGVVTALVGAPFFLLLVLKSRNTLQ